MFPYSSDPFRDNQRAASRSRSHLVGNGGQAVPSQFGAVPTLANTGLDTAMRARASMQARQQQNQQQQAAEKADSHARALSHLDSNRLIVPGRVTGPIGSSQLIPTLFNINRLGHNHQPTKPPRIGQHRVEARAATKSEDKTGIVIYGREMYTHKSVALLIIKTRLISRDVQTELTALSNDVIINRAAGPIVVDLSDYDFLRDIKSSDLPDWFDAIIINVGGNVSGIFGIGGDIQIILILKGNDRGIYVYKSSQPNVGVGLNISVGATVGFVDFNEKNDRHLQLSPLAFAGNSQSWSGGFAYGGGLTTSYTDGEWHLENAWRLDMLGVDASKVTYRAYAASGPQITVPLGTGLKYGVQYSFTRSELFPWGSFPFNR